MQEMYRAKAHNGNIVSPARADRNPLKTVLTKLSDLYKQNEQTFEIVGDVIGAISLFVMLFGGLIVIEVLR